MGQKVCPIGLRIGIVEEWRSRWYAGKKQFGTYLVEDQKIRRHIKANYRFAGVSRIEIERTKDVIRLYLACARPGLIIGRKGAELEKLKKELETFTSLPVNLNIREVDRPELDSQLMAENIADQLLKRAPFRRVLRRSIETAEQFRALGIKIIISGRLGGAEIARTEKVQSGALPLHTLRAKIDYGFTFAVTKSGTIGVKVWIYKGMAELKQKGGKTGHADAETGQVSESAQG